MDGVKLGSSFESGADGDFVITRTVPASESAGSATLVIRGDQVDLADSAITITDTKRPESRPVQSVAVARLMVNQVPASVEQGDAISVSGTGEPGEWVKYDLAGDDGSLLTTGVKNIDSAGFWKLETAIPHQASAGGYSLDVTDGRTDLARNLKIISVLMIEIEPTKDRFSPGQNITFTGTVDANRSVDAILVDPPRHGGHAQNHPGRQKRCHIIRVYHQIQRSDGNLHPDHHAGLCRGDDCGGLGNEPGKQGNRGA